MLISFVAAAFFFYLLVLSSTIAQAVGSRWLKTEMLELLENLPARIARDRSSLTN